MQPIAPQQPIDPQKRYTTLLTLWGAIFANVGILFVVANVAGPDPATLAENRMLTLMLVAFAIVMMLVSILFRQKQLARAIEQQRPEAVQVSYIIAFAMCEVAALCGLLLRFLTNERYYYLLFVIAAVGFLLNRPRRSDVIDAVSGKRL